MHVLSQRHHAEFLAVPQLVRATLATGADGLEPTFLIKASTLLLRYISQADTLTLPFFRTPRNCLGYGIKIEDDPSYPAVVWSMMESEDERSALRSMIFTPNFVTFLFNELVVNASWARSDSNLCAAPLMDWIHSAHLCSSQDTEITKYVSLRLDDWITDKQKSEEHILKVVQVKEWNEIVNWYISSQAIISRISAFEPDEGGQQEETAFWLIDELNPQGAAKNPTVYMNSGSRELCDLLLSHSYGSVLFESKTLAILSRQRLPTRSKLSANLKKQIAKASKQLSGAIRSMKQGYPIADTKGNLLNVERDVPPHAIILVPDLTLLDQAEEFGSRYLREFCRKTSGLLQILDLKQLFRMVQAAQMLERHAKTSTRMMCFDAHLIRRFEFAIQHNTPNFDFVLRIEK